MDEKDVAVEVVEGSAGHRALRERAANGDEFSIMTLVALENGYPEDLVPGVTLLPVVDKDGSEVGCDEEGDGFRYFVNKLPNGMYAAVVPSPTSLAKVAGTPYRAIELLVRELCARSRSGRWNPHYPRAQGSPPIQHAIELLQEHLAVEVANRKRLAASKSENYSGASEVVSSIATAIAALGRVKEA